MGKFIKFLFLAALLSTGLYAASFAGARTSVGKYLGPDAPVSDRQMQLEWKGIEQLPNRPRGWVATFVAPQLGVPRIEIYVSLTGTILGTRPSDLAVRLDQHEQSREP